VCVCVCVCVQVPDAVPGRRVGVPLVPVLCEDQEPVGSGVASGEEVRGMFPGHVFLTMIITFALKMRKVMF